MPRIVKEEEYALRRCEILRAARQLVYTKGYEQMTIQNILDALNISKGAFYHYFQSKQDLLQGLVDSLIIESRDLLTPLVYDPEQAALAKLQQFFDIAISWKTAQKDYLLRLVQGWYSDDNVIVRQKIFDETVKEFAPMLAHIIRQGIGEGSFNNPLPDQAGEVLLAIMNGLGTSFASLILAGELHPQHLSKIAATLEAYNDALVRVLGAPKGSLKVVEPKVVEQWMKE